MTRFAIRLGVVLACATGWAVLPASAADAAPGFETALTELPGRFVAGGDVERVTAVVSTSLDDGCRKVRWSLVVRVQGLRLDHLELDRIEATGSVPLDVQDADGAARLTDRALDPGTLCRGRTVTAQYRLAVDERAPAGQLTLTAEAYDAGGRLLDQASATREVVGDRAGRDRRPSPTPERPRPTPTGAEPTEEATEAAPVETEETDSPVLAEGPEYAQGGDAGPGAGRANTGGTGIGPAELGFIAGGLLLFLGGGLLLRIWTWNRGEPEPVRPAGRNRRARPSYPPMYQTPATTARHRPRGARSSYDW